MSFYSVNRFIFSPVLRLIFGIRRTGGRNLPSNGAVIVCSNHRSNYDPVILGASLRRDLNFMAKAELFKNPFLRVLVKAFGAFPVRRGRGDSVAIAKAADILKEGKVLAMFPEGTRLKDGGTPLRFKSGASRLAYNTHAVVIPVAIVTKGAVRPFKRNIVRVGTPISYEELGFAGGNIEDFHKASEILHEKVDELIHG